MMLEKRAEAYTKPDQKDARYRNSGDLGTAATFHEPGGPQIGELWPAQT